MTTTYPYPLRGAKGKSGTALFNGLYVKTAMGTIATSQEQHAAEIACTATMTASSAVVGLNCITTAIGTSATWAASAYFQMVQSTTAAVSGYACAGEFEVKSSAGVANAGNHYCIMLDSNIDSTGSECQAYIALQDFGAVATGNLFYGLGLTPATTTASSLFSTVASARTHTHSLGFRMSGTRYYIMCTTTGA